MGNLPTPEDIEFASPEEALAYEKWFREKIEASLNDQSASLTAIFDYIYERNPNAAIALIEHIQTAQS